MLKVSMNIDKNYSEYSFLHEDKKVGHIELELHKGYAWVYNVHIDEQYRGKGLSKQMLNEAVDLVKERKVKFLFLEVEKANKIAIKAYKKVGFKYYKTCYQAPYAMCMKKEI